MRKCFLIGLIGFFPFLLLSQENSAIACADGVDNDGDGLIDCEDGDCAILPNQGCATCGEGISFADTLLEYVSGCPLSDPFPEGALGVSDYLGGTVDGPDFVFLGQGGYIKLGFTNNILINSGDAQEDFWVFEIGPGVEACELALRPNDAYTLAQLQLLGIPDANGDGYYEVGNISGSASSFDIDALMPGYPTAALKFDAIEVRDVLDDTCWGGTPGADIDAVCALSFIPIVPVDCAGTPNGTAVIDECGECLEPDDPAFNQSCADCAGVPNGMSVVDLCGVCLLPNDPAFNQSCAVEKKVFIPTVFSPNGDGVNDRFQIFAAPGAVNQVLRYTIYDYWGEWIFEAANFDLETGADWWDGRFRGQELKPGVFAYSILVEYYDGQVQLFMGTISLVR